MIKKEKTAILIIDLQERLLQAMEADVAAQVIYNNETLVQLAYFYKIPLLFTEQYPRGLGSTVKELTNSEFKFTPNYPHYEDNISFLEKTNFNALAEAPIKEKVTSLKNKGFNKIIITGSETHICVLQTALALKAEGFEVFIIEDAVCSRKKSDYKKGLKIAEKAGCQILTTEIAAYILMEKACTPEFKCIAKRLK